jgi:hypothetical protein
MYISKKVMRRIIKMKLEELIEKMKELSAEAEKMLECISNADNHNILPGEHFTYNGIEFVCLDVFDNKMFAITSENVKSMEFSDTCDDGSNDWRKSKIRTWLNEEFIKKFNTEDLIVQTSELVADNGDDSYGKCQDYITLLSCDQYRKYRKFIPTYDDWVLTITPSSCSTGTAIRVRIVTTSGALYYSYTHNRNVVAPVCLFNLEHLKLSRQAHLEATNCEDKINDCEVKDDD